MSYMHVHGVSMTCNDYYAYLRATKISCHNQY